MALTPKSIAPAEIRDLERRPMSLYPQLPSERPPDGDWVTQVGASTLKSYESTGRLWFTLLGALATIFEPGRAASNVAWRIAVRQTFFSGFQALPLVSVIAVMVGATISIQTHLMAASIPGELVGRVLFALIIRELAPVATAIIVAGRSGTAIATELGNMKVNSEIFALSSLGIDPIRILVMPRIIACVVSVLVLTVYFGATALIGGFLTGLAISSHTLESLRAGFVDAVLPADLLLYLTKCIGLGTLVGWLCCHFGLEAQTSPTEVPQRASQAVVMTLLGCVLFNTVITALFYGMVGPLLLQ